MTSFSTIAGIKIGLDFPVRIMGVINASPESFFKGSVRISEKAIARLAHQMQTDGADFIDVGAMSSAPYLKTEISEKEEAHRLSQAVKAIKKGCSLPISIDTYRWSPAVEGLNSGAVILNDISGLSSTPELALLAKQIEGLILMANPKAGVGRKFRHPIFDIKVLFKKSLALARRAGCPSSKIVLDPGIGFFRQAKIPWWQWDLKVLAHLQELTNVGFPLLVGVSRKSFIGHLMGGVSADKRLSGSLAATTIAVLNGASIIRTHDVRSNREAILIAEKMRSAHT